MRKKITGEKEGFSQPRVSRITGILRGGGGGVVDLANFPQSRFSQRDAEGRAFPTAKTAFPTSLPPHPHGVVYFRPRYTLCYVMRVIYIIYYAAQYITMTGARRYFK